MVDLHLQEKGSYVSSDVKHGMNNQCGSGGDW